MSASVRLDRTAIGRVLLVVGLVALLTAMNLVGWVSLKSTLVPVAGLIACFVAGHFRPRTALALAFAAPFASGLPYVSSIGSQGENLGTLVALAVILRVAVQAERRSRRTATRLVLPFVGLTLLVLALFPHGQNSASSMGQAMLHAGVVAAATCLLRPDLPHLARIMAAPSFAVAYLAVSNPAVLVDRTTDVVAGLNANGVGLIAAIGLVAAVVGVILDSWWWRPLHIGVAAACMAGVGVSQSRGAYLDVAIAALVVLGYRLIKKQTVTGRLSLVLLVGVALYVGPVVVRWAGVMTGRFTEVRAENESLASRFEAASYSVQVAMDHPLWGVGISNLAEFSSQNRGEASVRSHIVYLGVLGEAGVLPFVLLAILATSAFIRSRRAGPFALALCTSTMVAGLSVNWWPASGTGTVCLSILAWGAALRTQDRAISTQAPPPKEVSESAVATLESSLERQRGRRSKASTVARSDN